MSTPSQVPYDKLKIRAYKASPEAIKWLLQLGSSAAAIHQTSGDSDENFTFPCRMCQEHSLGPNHTIMEVEDEGLAFESLGICALCLCKDDAFQAKPPERLLTGPKGSVIAVGDYPTRMYLMFYLRELHSIVGKSYSSLVTDEQQLQGDKFLTKSRWGRTQIATEIKLPAQIVPMMQNMFKYLRKQADKNGSEGSLELAENDLERMVDRLIERMAPVLRYRAFVSRT